MMSSGFVFHLRRQKKPAAKMITAIRSAESGSFGKAFCPYRAMSKRDSPAEAIMAITAGLRPASTPWMRLGHS